MIPSLSLQMSSSSGIDGAVNSGASSGNGSGAAGTAPFPAGNDSLMKYGLIAAAALVGLVVILKLRK